MQQPEQPSANRNSRRTPTRTPVGLLASPYATTASTEVTWVIR
jgi:hypothetical protein